MNYSLDCMRKFGVVSMFTFNVGARLALALLAMPHPSIELVH